MPENDDVKFEPLLVLIHQDCDVQWRPSKRNEQLLVAVNGEENNVLDVHEAEKLLAPVITQDDLEIWVREGNGSSLCALMNARRGWLMFLRSSGDTGFSSRNFAHSHSENDTEDFVLANGQVDTYPSLWTYERDAIFDAILEFVQSGICPSSIDWHDDGAN